MKRPSPLFDLSVMSGIQSYLEPQRGILDPWGHSLLGDFFDMVIYSDEIRFSLPSPNGTVPDGIILEEPSLLNDLMKAEPKLISPAVYSTAELRKLSKESVDTSFHNFAGWALRYKRMLKKFCVLHSSDFITKYQRTRIKNAFTFDLSEIEDSILLKKLSASTSISEAMLLYAFDLSLRMPYYGEIAGEGAFYLNHPIRDAFKIPAANEVSASLPPVAITFASTIKKISRKNLDRRLLINTILVLRELVREHGLIGAAPGDFEPETVRELATRSTLPPRLRLPSHTSRVVTGIARTAAHIAIAGPAGAITGTAVSVAGSAWKASPLLPSKVGQISWLRWALKWDIEDQTRGR
jgi:hypothetical protein